MSRFLIAIYIKFKFKFKPGSEFEPRTSRSLAGLQPLELSSFNWRYRSIFIVLMGWSLLPKAMHATFFRIYCAPLNFGIRTWICRLHFAQRPIFSGFRFFNEPEISDLGPPDLSPPGGPVLRIFMSWKIHRSQLGWTCKPWISRRAHYPKTTEADWTTQ